MTSFKDPVRQREYQSNRHAWMAIQRCSLCGHGTGLRIFQNMGAPKITWSVKGPSNRLFRVVCGDPDACLRRRSAPGLSLEVVPEKPVAPKETPISTEDRRKLRALRGTPESKIERDLRKRDERPACPDHGPRNTMIHKGAVRFVCCGRTVPGMKPEPKPWWQRDIA